MFYIATNNGFIVTWDHPKYGFEVWTTSDIRVATPFKTFQEADEFAKKCTAYPYYAVLCTNQTPVSSV